MPEASKLCRKPRRLKCPKAPCRWFGVRAVSGRIPEEVFFFERGGKQLRLTIASPGRDPAIRTVEENEIGKGLQQCRMTQSGPETRYRI